MSGELKVTRSQLDLHRKTLNAGFRKALGGGVQDHYVASAPLADGTALTVSRGAPNTRRIDNDLNVPEVALDIAAASQGCLACSFYEQWKPLGNRHVVFKQASLRFFWIYEDQGPQHVQVFRLEWVGAEKKPKSSEEEEDSYTFQGEYAAHPHWHFDRFAQYETRAQLLAELQGVDDVVTVDLEEISEDQLERLTAPERPRALDLRWFPKIHFPALAGWNRGGAWDAGCDNVPHQCIPDSPQQIESWVYSALCYIRYEMAKHL